MGRTVNCVLHTSKATPIVGREMEMRNGSTCASCGYLSISTKYTENADVSDTSARLLPYKYSTAANTHTHNTRTYPLHTFDHTPDVIIWLQHKIGVELYGSIESKSILTLLLLLLALHFVSTLLPVSHSMLDEVTQ